ncbi:cytidine and dCMP deaminase domain-containing protein 1-like isoform X2 [Metopolophium dirhodum]|uniref:cytidine and dCMP deaminase domain-containing protein 1-like isoform X2 n=1 Tax=Metopolophium dirhodum TaxID=44670 RepID=UPI00298F48CE|nr:cytidine and dCMP deaminase domain-containing protein 1-like isoform X2 [Metopolophium dirhodum]
MKRCSANNDSAMNEQNQSASCSKITKNVVEYEAQISSIDETTDSYDDIIANNTSGIEQEKKNEKRTNCLSWDDLFMAIAFLTAKCNKDQKKKVGACIVDSDKKIVGIGYNGMPTGCNNKTFLDHDFACFFECHAEMNAILNKNTIHLQNCTIFVSRYPCSESAKIIIQSGIKEVVHLPDPILCKNPATKKMFDASGVEIREHTPNQNITIDFFKHAKSDGPVADLSGNNLFMAISYLTAKRSKDPVCQVGACIVNSDNKIVGTGYNGMPTGCNNDEFPWGNNKSSALNKFIYVCHAEMNAVFYRSSMINVKGCTLYVTRFPCIECAKIIIQSGIKEVVYLTNPKNGKKRDIATKVLFNASGVKIDVHKQNLDITLDFSKTA